MAKEGERSAPADKGKGKVEDVKDLPGGKNDQKEEKSAADGKKKEEPKEGMPVRRALRGHHLSIETLTKQSIEELSEEDLQLKNDLEMLVERLKVWL